MFRPQANSASPPRRGVILLVVVALLTLFAIVGLSFVLYADSAARSSQIFRESEAQSSRVDLQPELLMSFFLSQMVFDPDDDQNGVYSALRGHGLARLMYGQNYTGGGVAPIVRADNSAPFAGTGRLKTGGRNYPPGPVPPPLFSADDYELINYTYFPRDGFLRDPERPGGTGIRIVPPGVDPLLGPPNPYVAPANVPYTYPDLNNMFLGAVGSGTIGGINYQNVVLMPSFHRPWLFGPLDRNNPNWMNPGGKYLILRPRPADHSAAFPYPEDEGGDIKNLVGSPGYFNPITGQLVNNDSIWIDLGYPVMTTPDGRKKFKPLFAPLIIDLDNRLNVNVHGNVRGLEYYNPSSNASRPAHSSNQGWGPWEVNLSKVLDFATPPPFNPEWTNLFSGIPTPPIFGRYGFGTNAQPGNNPPPNRAVQPMQIRFYSQFDYDGSNEGDPAKPYSPTPAFNLLPPMAATQQSCFPAPAPGFGSGRAPTGPQPTPIPPDELQNHPLLFNPFQPAFYPLPTGVPAGDRLFPVSNMEALLRFGDVNGPGLDSDLLRLLPNNLIPNNIPQTVLDTARRRRQLTTHSFDPDRPGLSPYLWTNPVGTQTPPPPPAMWQYDAINNPQGIIPRASEVPFPTNDSVLTGLPPTGTSNGEFGLNMQSIAAALGRLDLNRPLPDYPPLDTNPGNPTYGRITDLVGFQAATQARQQLANDIFTRLKLVVTGQTANGPDLNLMRWLAQLAVNIVDFIDNDDYSTPFSWNTPGIDVPPFVPNPPGSVGTEWVYGTEMPKLLINEVAAYYQAPTMGATTNVFVWAELHNPLNTNTDPTLPPQFDNNAVKLEMPGTTTYGIYQVQLAGPASGAPSTPPATYASPELRAANNSSGAATGPNAMPYAGATVSTWSTGGGAMPVPYPTPRPPGPADTRIVMPSDGRIDVATAPPAPGAQTVDAAGGPSNLGYYVLGPAGAPFTPPGLTPTYTNAGMMYTLTVGPMPTPATVPPVTVLLRRLACPHLPPQTTTPSAPDYNPYITVDYMEDVPLQNGAAPNPPPSYGRNHPYKGHYANRTPTGGMTPHTFFARNTPQTGGLPFNWLVHRDRYLISPMELLHVSGFKPHELTQEFGRPNGPLAGYNHRVPWFDEDLASGPGYTPPPGPGAASHRLYRLFELIETRNRMSGLTAGVVTVTTPVTATPPTSPATVVTMTTRGISASGVPWNIRAGSVLAIRAGSPPALTETIRVENVTVTSISARFLRDYPNGFDAVLTDTGDRIPGKVNINTVWDIDTFRALCDAQVSNYFLDDSTASPPSPNTVQEIWAALKTYRTPGVTAPGMYPDIPGPTDMDRTVPPLSYLQNRPFRSLSVGLTPPGQQYLTGLSIQDTIFRSLAPTIPAATPAPGAEPVQRLLEVRPPSGAARPTAHPYMAYELMNKLFNNLTTRSNVFAVWVTVGFFEVVDESTRPVKLGAEIGRAENRHVRHRMFSIVDRTNLLATQKAVVNVDPTQTAAQIAQDAQNAINNLAPAFTAQVFIPPGEESPAPVVQLGTAVPGPGVRTVTPSAMSGTIRAQIQAAQGAPFQTWRLDWNIQTAPSPRGPNFVEGTVLLVGSGANQELIVVRSVNLGANPPTFTANFNNSHAANEPIAVLYVPGNPGPQPRFDYRFNTAVVPYVSVIQ
jgi:hypothetical protein